MTIPSKEIRLKSNNNKNNSDNAGFTSLSEHRIESVTGYRLVILQVLS